jgi:hypothetical protein
MQSSFAWLDFSATERDKVLEVVKSLRNSESRDEMGIGVIRDRIADILFPGTSTIHTRLKYFLYIPWIFQKLDTAALSQNFTPEEARLFVREAEEKLLGKLRRSDDTEGVIGIDAGTNVETMPSQIYWGGLGIWGIRKYPKSRQEYFRELHSIVRVLQGTEDSHVEPPSMRWDPELPAISDTDDVTIHLTSKEALYFHDLFQSRLVDSLLAYLILRGKSTNTAFPWGEDIDASQVKLKNDLWHAQNFSEVMYGINLCYNFLLAQKRNDAKLIESYIKRLHSWSDQLSIRWKELNQWYEDIPVFWSFLGIQNVPKGFVNRWLDFVFNHQIIDILHDSPTTLNMHPVAEFIQEREHKLKKSRARLTNPAMLQQWTGASGINQLNYRWFTARTYINEIADALGTNNATAE